MPPSMPGRAPGFYDRTAQETAAAATVTADLQRTMARFGYQYVETPLVEYADLFLIKSGDEAINRLFNFEMYGRQLCLRSEFTAPAARLYIERFQHEPKPIRWQFAGPIFRYESPQRSHSRQFTMLGTELIGPSGVSGDAETMALAAQGLLALGLRDWKLVIGNVGLVGQLLDRFTLDRRTRRLVLGHIENLRRPDRGRAYVVDQFEQIYAGLPEQIERLEQAVDVPHDDVSRALQLLLESANLGTTGTGRSNEDVARRLLTKQQQASQRGEVMRALDFLEGLVAIEGTPAEAFRELESMLPHDDTVWETERDFRAAVEMLSAYGIEPEQIYLQMGLARGLNYYSGIVFEVHTHVGDSASQLCGGGRYDDLIRVLGAAQDTPAIGFAYGLERILQELRRTGDDALFDGPRALVVPIDEVDSLQAAHTATVLREYASVELFTPPTRNLSDALAYANKRDTPYVVIIGTAEREANHVTVKDMRAGTQFTCPLNDLSMLTEKLAHD